MSVVAMQAELKQGSRRNLWYEHVCLQDCKKESAYRRSADAAKQTHTHAHAHTYTRTHSVQWQYIANDHKAFSKKGLLSHWIFEGHIWQNPFCCHIHYYPFILHSWYPFGFSIHSCDPFRNMVVWKYAFQGFIRCLNLNLKSAHFAALEYIQCKQTHTCVDATWCFTFHACQLATCTSEVGK